MTPSQMTRTMNWVAMPVAIVLLTLVAYHVYQRHFVQQQAGLSYQFDDLPDLDKAPITADINGIVSQHIFGTVPKTPVSTSKVVVKAPPKAAPKTRLDIKLTGVIDSETPESGMAMLEVERGRTLVVAVGEKIGKTDAVLHQVLPGEILIDRDGTIESVKMVRKTLALNQAAAQQYDSLPQPYIDQAAAGHEDETASTEPTRQYSEETDGADVKKRGKRERMGTMGSLPLPRKLQE